MTWLYLLVCVGYGLLYGHFPQGAGYIIIAVFCCFYDLSNLCEAEDQ